MVPRRLVVIQEQLDLLLPVSLGHSDGPRYFSIGARTTLPHSVQEPS